MLSKRDIYKELGHGINIVPLNIKNIKENSINVTASHYCWTMAEGKVWWCGEAEFHIDNSSIPANKKKQSCFFRKGSRAVFSIKGQNDKVIAKYLILLPHATTIIETKEVIGLGERIGGAVHSKVGIVSKGIGDTGTMLGPGYCGHLLLSLHNITDDVVAIPLDSTIVSLTFDYLTTPVQRTSATSSSHYDKLLEMGVFLLDKDKLYFSEDWKTNLLATQREMKKTNEYQIFVKQQKDESKDAFLKWFSWPRIIAIVVIISLVIGGWFLTNYLDVKFTTDVWSERYWMILIATIVAYVVPKLFNKVFE